MLAIALALVGVVQGNSLAVLTGLVTVDAGIVPVNGFVAYIALDRRTRQAIIEYDLYN